MNGAIPALVALILTSACATDYRIDPVFADREPTELVPVEPVRPPDPPDPVAADAETITFDRDGLADIMQAWEAADGNADMLDAQGTAMQHLQAEQAALIEAGQAREEQLEQLHRAYRREVWYRNAAVGVVVGLLVLR